MGRLIMTTSPSHRYAMGPFLSPAARRRGLSMGYLRVSASGLIRLIGLPSSQASMSSIVPA